MKHLKSHNEHKNTGPGSDNAEMKFYWEVFKAAKFFKNFEWHDNNKFVKSITFQRASGRVLNTFDLKQFVDRSLELDFNNISFETVSNLGDIMEILNQPGKDLIYHFEKWDEAQIKIWQKALELDPSLFTTCPTKILKQIKPNLGNVKDIGVFDKD